MFANSLLVWTVVFFYHSHEYVTICSIFWLTPIRYQPQYLKRNHDADMIRSRLMVGLTRLWWIIVDSPCLHPVETFPFHQSYVFKSNTCIIRWFRLVVVRWHNGAIFTLLITGILSWRVESWPNSWVFRISESWEHIEQIQFLATTRHVVSRCQCRAAHVVSTVILSDFWHFRTSLHVSSLISRNMFW